MKKKNQNHIIGIISLLDKREKRNLGIVFLSAVVMAVIQIIGVGSVMPFMAVAANPESIYTNEYLHWAYMRFGFQSESRFLIVLGVGVLAFLILTNAAKALMQYIKVRFTSMRQFTLGRKLMDGYLRMPYVFFLDRNSYDFVKNIMGEVTQIIRGTMIQFVEVLTKSIQVLLLILFLFIVNPLSTLIITLALSVTYGLIYFFLRDLLKDLGEERYNLNHDRAKVVSEAFWGIKDVKIMGNEHVFLNEFAIPSKKMAKNKATNEIVSFLPKFFLEAVAFSSIMIYVLYSIVQSGSFANAAASVTLFAYAGYRMIPSVQGLFQAITKLRYAAPTAIKILAEYETVSKAPKIQRKGLIDFIFSKSLKINDITFTYPNCEEPVLKNVNLDILENSTVGFAGTTGSGKTTLIDIILGLLRPQNGNLSVNERIINDDLLRSWQMNLGYVPQTIYLSNDSLASNIAFGVPKDKIDMDAVRRAAEMAQLSDFVEESLSEKYDTFVGERGVKLSGGQRQRVGIARALYRNPSILVLDEATSALDGHTEEAVMNAVDSLMGTKTIIMIAHRLSTLRNCDRIFLLEKGTIIDSGKYDELVERNPYFSK